MYETGVCKRKLETVGRSTEKSLNLFKTVHEGFVEPYMKWFRYVNIETLRIGLRRRTL